MTKPRPFCNSYVNYSVLILGYTVREEPIEAART